jgi:pentatricopeptide repeat protein
MPKRQIAIFGTLAFFSLLIIMCGKQESERKIRLAGQESAADTADQLSTTIHFEPAEQRAIAVLFFENKTGEEEFSWLRQGIAEMFIRTLSQSSKLSVLPVERLYEIYSRLGEVDAGQAVDMDMAAFVAREANLEAVITGHIEKQGDSLSLHVKVHEPEEGLVLQEEHVEDSGMEKLLSMVDELTARLKDDLQGPGTLDGSPAGIAELTTSSLEAWRHYTRGMEYHNQLLRDLAMKEYQKAIELDSTFVSAHIGLLAGYNEIGRLNEVLNTLNTLIRLRDHAMERERYTIDFVDATVKMDIQRILEINRERAEKFPYDRDVISELAGFYMGTSNYEQAIHYYERVLEIDPKHKLTYNQLAYSHARNGNYEKAFDYLNDYMEMVPDEPNPYDSRGEIYLYQGDFQEAEASFFQSLEKNEQFYFAWEHLGMTYLDSGQFDKAREAFNRYGSLVPEGQLRQNALLQEAQCFWAMGERTEALKCLETARAQDELSAAPVSIMWLIYREMGDEAGAVNVMRTYFRNLADFLGKNSGSLDQILTLGVLSLLYGFEPGFSMDIMEKRLAREESLYQRIRLQVVLSFLYARYGEDDKLRHLQEQILANEFIGGSELLKMLGYEDIWKFYGIVNKAFAERPEPGLEYYDVFMRAFADDTFPLYRDQMRMMKADLYRYTGQEEQASKIFSSLGIPEENNWYVIGPFPNENGFGRAFLDEEKFEWQPRVSVDTLNLEWHPLEDGIEEGYVNLAEMFSRPNWAAAYGLIYARLPYSRKVLMQVGADESYKIWVNDREVWRKNRPALSAIPDNYAIPVTLRKGLNRILIKVVNRISEWGYYFRITDEEKKGIPDLQFLPPPEAGRPRVTETS